MVSRAAWGAGAAAAVAAEEEHRSVGLACKTLHFSYAQSLAARRLSRQKVVKSAARRRRLRPSWSRTAQWGRTLTFFSPQQSRRSGKRAWPWGCLKRGRIVPAGRPRRLGQGKPVVCVLLGRNCGLARWRCHLGRESIDLSPTCLKNEQRHRHRRPPGRPALPVEGGRFALPRQWPYPLLLQVRQAPRAGQPAVHPAAGAQRGGLQAQLQDPALGFSSSA